MCTAGNVVEEKRLAGIDLVDTTHPINGVVCHRRGQVPARLTFERIDLCRVAEQVRLPLVRIATDETIEILEAHPDWPLVKRPHLTGRKRGCVVVLTEPRGGITVVSQDAADGCLVLGNDAVVAGEASGLFGNHSEASRVMIAARDQGSTCG